MYYFIIKKEILQTTGGMGVKKKLNPNLSMEIFGTDDLEEEGYIAHILGVTEDEGNEITESLNQVIQ